MPTSITIGGPGYRGSMIYWGVVALVTVVFMVTTIAYWKGTIRIIDENTTAAIETGAHKKQR
ncbi:MAG: hypothetical protein Q8Q39_04115 [bacterium]|nr:hypothetical protein [bacterium]